MFRKVGKPLSVALILALVLSLIPLHLAVNAVPGVNLVNNPGFEDGYVEEGPWVLVSHDGGEIIIDKNEYDPRNGDYSLKFFFWNDEEPTSGSVLATQTIEGLAEGTYSLKAWASGDGDEPKQLLQMYIEGYGGERLFVDIENTGWGEWHEYTIENIHVTNDTVTIGFIVEVEDVWNAYGYFDDVEFYRIPDEDDITISDPGTFIKGVDISTLQAIEDAGGKYYYNDVEMDLLDILAAHGVNYIRLRIWNDPVEADGYNDTAKTVEMAERLKQKGFKLLLDFHYSDFWADPGNQKKPAAWEDLSFEDLKSAVYDYTEEVMNALEAVNAYPDMVQIGNEINPGMLLPDGSSSADNFSNLAQLIAAGVQAVRDTTPAGHEVKIMLHLAEGGSNSRFVSFFDRIEAHDIDYDVIGLSYYPFWHGTFKQLRDNMNDLVTRYEKEVVVVETSHAYTLNDGDGWGNIVGQRELDAAGFPASVEAQELVVRTVMNTVAHVKDGKGLGVFYWEPAWIPVPKDGNGRYQAGWKSGEGNAWDNQAMFDFNGHALPSLNVYKFLPGDITEKEIVHVMPTVGVTTAAGIPPELPDKVSVLYNEGDVQAADVTWDDIDPSLLTAVGTFTLNGDVNGTDLPAKIVITVVENKNLVLNPGFEMSNQFDHWQLSGDSVAKIEESSGNAHSGQRSVNYWSAADYAFTLSQEISDLDDGIYKLTAWLSGGGGEHHLNMFIEIDGGERLQIAATNTGWANWKQYTIEDIEVTSGQVTIGFDIDAPAEVWGNIDDVEFTLMSDDETGELPADKDNLVENSDFEDSDDGSWTIEMTGNAEVEIFAVEHPSQSLSGNHSLKYWFSDEDAEVQSGTFELFQTITGLKDGKYTLEISSMGGGGEDVLHMFIRDHGGEPLTQSFANTGWENWHEFKMEEIEVTGGKATIGVRAEAGLDKWGFFDDVVFYLTEETQKQPDPPLISPTPTPDPDTRQIGVTELLSRQDGQVVVSLAEGENSLSIQRNALQHLGNAPLIVRQNDLAIQIPSAVLQQLSALGGTPVDQAQIVLSIERITDNADSPPLPMDQPMARYRFGGQIYEINLSLITEDGQSLQAAQFNEGIQLQFSYEPDEMDEQLLGVYYYNDTTGEWEYVGGEIDVNGKHIIAQVDHFSKYTVLERDKSFQDVTEQYWAHRVIQVLAAQHVIKGVTEQTFAPEHPITRAQFAALLVRALQLSAEQTPPMPFTDIPMAAWYAHEMALAYEAGLVQGKSPSHFDPNSLIKREEMAVLMVRAYELLGGELNASSGRQLADYDDASDISTWAEDEVARAIAYGLMQGSGQGMFRPTSHATRAEAAQVIYDLLFLGYN